MTRAGLFIRQAFERKIQGAGGVRHLATGTATPLVVVTLSELIVGAEAENIDRAELEKELAELVKERRLTEHEAGEYTSTRRLFEA